MAAAVAFGVSVAAEGMGSGHEKPFLSFTSSAKWRAPELVVQAHAVATTRIQGCNSVQQGTAAGQSPQHGRMFSRAAVMASWGAATAAFTVRRRGNRCGQRSRNPSICAAARGGEFADVGVVLLSAGVGKRMGASIPKQYLKLLGLEIALHSLNVFLELDPAEIVIVCAEDWQNVFEEHLAAKGKVRPLVKYTTGGKERQDSVSNGLALITTEYVAVHDAARPLVTVAEVEKVVKDARKYGAALLAVQTKATIKQAAPDGDGQPLVAATPNRKALWEAHTPQVLRAKLLRRGFDHAVSKSLEVTDDVSLVEFLGEPVKLTEGEYTNIKVTTPEDIAVAETILKGRGFAAVTSA